jgi:hypothetical protein
VEAPGRHRSMNELGPHVADHEPVEEIRMEVFWFRKMVVYWDMSSKMELVKGINWVACATVWE